MKPILLILIPTVPARRTMAWELWESLEIQAGLLRGASVELLMLCDNKTRTIGAKRQALLDAAQGEYVTFVDDDDEVSSDYVAAIAHKLLTRAPDVVVHPVRCTVNGADEGIVEMSVKYTPKDGAPLAEYRPPLTRRPPHELAVWKTSLARQSRFPDTSQGEDFLWAAPLWERVKEEVGIEHPIYHWRHEISRREHVEETR